MLWMYTLAIPATLKENASAAQAMATLAQMSLRSWESVIFIAAMSLSGI